MGIGQASSQEQVILLAQPAHLYARLPALLCRSGHGSAFLERQSTNGTDRKAEHGLPYGIPKFTACPRKCAAMIHATLF